MKDALFRIMAISLSISPLAYSLESPTSSPSKKHACGTPPKPAPRPAVVSTMAAEDLAGFGDYSPALQSLVQKALNLTQLNLCYQFGSCNPRLGGMDCSGAVYCVLHDCGFEDTPRQSDEICRW